VRQHLILGTKAHPLGRLHFKAHRAFEVPKMLSVSVRQRALHSFIRIYETGLV
jgi:hypothetical protein